MDIRESLNQVLASKDIVLEGFYARFLERYPELRHHFEGTNLGLQALMLTVALQAGVQHYLHHSPAMDAYLKYLGTKHHDLGVAVESYPKFAEMLVATVEQFHGSTWSPELAAQWREVISWATQTMLEGYRHRHHI